MASIGGVVGGWLATRFNSGPGNIGGALRAGLSISGLLVASCNSQPQSNGGPDNQHVVAADPDDIASTDLPERTLDRQALVRFINASQSFQRADQFSPEFDDQPIRGRRFHLTVHQDGPEGPVVNYDAKAKRVEIMYGLDYELGFNLIPLLTREHESAPEPRSNAFGATVGVTEIEKTVFGVGSEKCQGGLFKLNSNDYCDHLSAMIDANGDDARKMTEGISAEIDGEIIAGKDGHTISCDSDHEEATVSIPRDRRTRVCILNARISKVELHSPHGGALATWSR